MVRYTKLKRRDSLPASGFSVQPLAPAGKDTGKDKGTEVAAARRRRRRLIAKERAMVCFGCRSKGHSLKSCPKGPPGLQEEEVEGELLCCYACGSLEHSLAACPSKKTLAKMDLPFAKCFVCKAKGHLSGQCPANDKGLYPKGGGCKFCGSVRHMASECRPEPADIGVSALGLLTASQGGDDDDVFLSLYEESRDIKLPLLQSPVPALLDSATPLQTPSHQSQQQHHHKSSQKPQNNIHKRPKKVVKF